MTRTYDQAVSPVVAIMLMLVVTIIIAAVVSGFAGSVISSKQKAPQAQVSAKFSISNGFTISHNGGDTLATNDLVFMIRDGPTFGSNLEQITAQVVNKTLISNGNGTYLMKADGSTSLPAIRAGDALYIDATNSSSSILQPNFAPSDYTTSMGSSYTGTDTTHWSYCIRNSDNIGKVFFLEVSDKSGNLISKSEVMIS
jgi:archaeal type IV pilus assembly protein PilA